MLVIEGKSLQEQLEEKQAQTRELSIEEHMERFVSQGIDRKEAMKLVAKERGVSKRDIYQYLLDNE